MRILPVIDVLRGVAVRGVAGNREDYRPLQSRWTDGTDPPAVAAALRQAFGCRRFYLADLDGILTRTPNLAVYRRLAADGFELLIDAGVREAAEVGPILNSGAVAAIIGLETLRGPESLREMIEQFGAERIVFSLDLRGGTPMLPADAAWRAREPGALAEEALACGVRRMIVLDLADVGTGTGGSTFTLCREMLTRHPALELIAGGGVRGPDDVRHWAAAGIADLLVASALHDGRLSPGEGVF